MKTPVWNPQIRWYDYLAAFFAADILWTNIKVILFSGNMYGTFFAIIAVYFAWDIWNGWYCKKFRMRQEFEKFSAEVEQHMNDLWENRND